MRASFVGHGVVDFTTGDFRVIEVDHQIQFQGVIGQPPRNVALTSTEESIGIGKSI